jgi:hypothetical protein
LDEVSIRGRITIGGAAAATFADLQKMAPFWRTGIAIELVILKLRSLCWDALRVEDRPHKK